MDREARANLSLTQLSKLWKIGSRRVRRKLEEFLSIFGPVAYGIQNAFETIVPGVWAPLAADLVSTLLATLILVALGFAITTIRGRFFGAASPAGEWLRRMRGLPPMELNEVALFQEGKSVKGWKLGIAISALAIIVVLFGSLAFTSHYPMDARDPAGSANNSPIADEPEAITAGGGPAREGVSVKDRNRGPIINSATDNPIYGDERNFLRVGNVSNGNSLSDYFTVAAGDEFTVVSYFANSGSVEKGVAADDVRIRFKLPSRFSGAARVTSIIDSSNLTPATVWDGAVVRLVDKNQSAALRYVPESAKVVWGDTESKIDANELFSDNGALLGCKDHLDGVLLPSDNCRGYVVFDVRVDQPNFSVVALARVEGVGGELMPHVNCRVGDVLEIRVEYRNSGTVDQRNVTVRVANLPVQLDYIDGSTLIANTSTGSRYRSTADGIVGQGLNVGKYSPSANVYLKFRARVTSNGMSDLDRYISEIDSFAEVNTENGLKGAPLMIHIEK